MGALAMLLGVVGLVDRLLPRSGDASLLLPPRLQLAIALLALTLGALVYWLGSRD
jgi:hypothetical protein